MKDLESARACFARAAFGVVLKPGRGLIFAGAEVPAVTAGERTLVARLSATPTVVQPR